MVTLEWGVEVAVVELKGIQLPDGMKRAMAREAEGESLAAVFLGDAADTMSAPSSLAKSVPRPNSPNHRYLFRGLRIRPT